MKHKQAVEWPVVIKNSVQNQKCKGNIESDIEMLRRFITIDLYETKIDIKPKCNG